MKKMTVVICIAAFILFVPVVLAEQHKLLSQSSEQQHEQEPPYAKWGRLALQETKKKYPQAEVIDYLHVGRKALSPTVVQETFKFWLRQRDREYGVYVRITFHPVTEKVGTITFEETDR